MSKPNIGLVIGSLRKESFSRKIAQVFADSLQEQATVKELEIGNLQMFNQDYDDGGNTPAEWVRFRDEVSAMDAYLFVSPEYNRSIPPVLKNALDVASRPYGENRWGKKPGAIVTVSIGQIGGFGANHHLRQVLSFLDVYTMQQPEAYIGNVMELLNPDGTLKAEGTRSFIQSIAQAFMDWVRVFG